MDNQVVFLIIFFVSVTSTPGDCDDYLPTLTAGSTCLVGTYTRIYDTRCNSSIDDNTSAYTPPFGVGWMAVTMPTIAEVSHVGLLVVTMEEDDLSVTLHVPSSGGEARAQVDALMASGTYYASFDVFPVTSNSATLTWKTNRPLDVLDVRIIGSRQGMKSVAPTTTRCDNDLLAQCANVVDNNMLTTLFLTNYTTLTMLFHSGEAVSHLALYSHQLQPRASFVTVRLTISEKRSLTSETIDIRFRNQGWEDAGKWQVVELPKVFRTPLNVVFAVPGGRHATLSEIMFYYVEQKRHADERQIPPMHYNVGFVHKLNAVNAGWIPENGHSGTTLAVSTEEMVVSSARVNVQRELANVLDTKEGDRTNTFQADDVITSPTVDTGASADETDELLSSDVPATAASPLPGWFLLVAVVVLISVSVLVFMLVLLVALRVRQRRYSVSRSRRVVLQRNAGRLSPTVSIVTPTHGYFHLTLNSQSSDPELYSGVTPSNTTTFGQ